jgi:hypothetical protein
MELKVSGRFPAGSGYEMNRGQRMHRSLASFVVFLGATLFFTRPAFAYIDPGSGSMILQMLIAGIGAGWVAFKLFWHRIARFFSRKEKSGQSNEDKKDPA